HYTINGPGLSASNYMFAQAGGNATALTIASWSLTGFYQPVTMAGPTVFNSIKGGQTVPLKFNIYQSAGGPELTDVSAVQLFSLAVVACSAGAAVADVDPSFLTTGGTTLRYDGTAGQFIQNWYAPKG